MQFNKSMQFNSIQTLNYAGQAKENSKQFRLFLFQKYTQVRVHEQKTCIRVNALPNMSTWGTHKENKSKSASKVNGFSNISAE